MICPHHTPRAPSSPICAGLLFPSLPQHLFFQLGVTSRAPFSPTPGPRLTSLHPFTTVTHLRSGPLKDYFPCTYPCLSSYHTCQGKFSIRIPQWDISASTPGENHTTWTLVPCKSMATDAGPPELLINPFTCLQLISSLVSLNLHPVGVKPSHVWTSQLEEQIISLLSNWSVYWIWILPLEIKRLQTNRMNDPS